MNKKPTGVLPGKRSGHLSCCDCRTKRHNNRGNRAVRHMVKTILRKRQYE